MSISPDIKNRIIGLKSSYEEPYPVQIRGESSYKGNLENICGYHGEESYFADDHKAILYLEDDNQYDPGNAVRVEIDDLVVGYLSRPDAKKYRKRLTEVDGPENAIALCGASIRGGFITKYGEKADYGVRLDFNIGDFDLAPVRYNDDLVPSPAQSITSPKEIPTTPAKIKSFIWIILACFPAIVGACLILISLIGFISVPEKISTTDKLGIVMVSGMFFFAGLALFIPLIFAIIKRMVGKKAITN
jgi:hypothetical protein